MFVGSINKSHLHMQNKTDVQKQAMDNDVSADQLKKSAEQIVSVIPGINRLMHDLRVGHSSGSRIDVQIDWAKGRRSRRACSRRHGRSRPQCRHPPVTRGVLESGSCKTPTWSAGRRPPLAGPLPCSPETIAELLR
jgi:hypothetical protein